MISKQRRPRVVVDTENQRRLRAAKAALDGYSRYRVNAKDPGDKPAVIKVYGKIGPEDAVRAAGVKHKLQTLFASASTIEVIINSGGGSLADARQVYALLRADGRPITTRVAGACCSAATIVLLAGEYREAVAGSQFLLHEVEVRPINGRWTAAARDKEAEYLRKQNEELARFYAGRTGRTAAEFERVIKQDTEYDVKWAEDKGLIHKLLDPDNPQVF